MFNHFWLDLVGLVLSNFVCSVWFAFSQTQKKENKSGSVQELHSSLSFIKSTKGWP